MSAVLEMCDLFGITYVINTKGKEKFSTACGGCLTIFTVAIVSALTLLYGADFFFKKNGIVTENELTSADQQYIDIGNYDYPFMARLNYPNTEYLVSSRFQINFRYVHWTEEIPGQSKDICRLNGNTQKS